MPKLDRDTLTLIKNRINYYRDGDEVDTLTGALGLDDEEDRLGGLLVEEILPLVDNMFENEDEPVNTAIILVAFIDLTVKHSNSDEELFTFLTTGWSSVMDYIKDRARRHAMAQLLGGMLEK